MKRIPIGVEDFRELREGGYYYIDKTAMIADLLKDLTKVTLFTRPRRFGKTLNMSMLRHFFEIGSNPGLFDGLAIEKQKELCERYQGKYPVIFLTLKSVDALHFTTARNKLARVINMEARRHRDKIDRAKMNPDDWNDLDMLSHRSMEDAILHNSLRDLSGILRRYYDKPVIILIDEYDVPLAKASDHKFYQEMTDLIRGLLEALKTNENLTFSVLTGCLRISKESIFTGLNNLKVRAITDVKFDSYFGFTEEEVGDLAAYYGISDKLGVIKEWYDGYLFGSRRVYCPWSVLNYCEDVLAEEKEPASYWKNSSSNTIIRKFADRSDDRTRKALERLISGDSVEQAITQELTYDELEDSIDNLWSVLFLTGYLTCRESFSGRKMELVIPNKEIHEIYTEQIEKWFAGVVKSSPDTSLLLCRSLTDGNIHKIEALLNSFLLRSISIRDTMTRSPRENFYHGLLLGLLNNVDGWTVQSNVESGTGYSDLLFRANDFTDAVILELKYGLKNAEAAMAQIDKKQYAAILSGYDRIWKYGIAFEGKECRVVGGEENST